MGTKYLLFMICAGMLVARSSVYTCQMRGPGTPLSVVELVEEIRTVLKDSHFLGEDHQLPRRTL